MTIAQTPADIEFAAIVGELTRRGFLGGTLGGAALLGLAACGSSGGTSEPRASAPATPFGYTDARGTKIDLPSTPTIVVAQSSTAAALWDAGYHVTGVYGELGTVDGKLDYQAGNLDLSGLTVIGRTYGEFDLEKYAALNPQLLVDACMDGKTLWYVPADIATKVQALAPTIGMRMLGLDTPALIAEYVDLAVRLGARADSGDARQDKADFEAATAAVRTAAAERSGLRVLAVSLTAETFYVGDPRDHPDLKHLATLGVDLVVPDGKAGTFFHELSWEQAGRYPADVIVYDGRGGDPVPEKVARIATWRTLPAVQAGQVYPWWPAAPYSYRAYAPLYRDVARWLDASHPLT